ncbi:cupredoxin domain-containing protein [Candidatus Micrarchaeota archaeon]|nr:cupredoxin domain-containing protein [Candidatus Micrarchaeota archaeon]
MNEITISKRKLMLVVGLILIFGVYFLLQSVNASSNTTGTASGNVIVGGEAQKITIKALNTGYYDPQTITVKKGQPVELAFFADKGSGCGSVMFINEFNVRLKNGEKATFTPTQAGEYIYHCSMYMFAGKLLVV